MQREKVNINYSLGYCKHGFDSYARPNPINAQIKNPHKNARQRSW